jgi:hypothetical protein
MAKIESTEFEKYDDQQIRSTWTNRISDNVITLFTLLRNEIQKVLDEIPDQDYPEWFTESFNSIISEFLLIVKSGSNQNPQSIQNRFYAFRSAILYDKESNQFPFPTLNYSLPFLENYAKTIKLSGELSKLYLINKSIDESIDNMQNASLITINSLEERFQKFKVEADSTLSLLNKQTGKIAVKEYAAIFEKQAYEHSNLFIDGEDTNKKKYNLKCFGKAQRWISFALLAFVCLIFSFTQLDKFFSLKDQYIFTPEVIVHIVGRFLLISLFIFIVSFSFKQFRINCTFIR